MQRTDFEALPLGRQPAHCLATARCTGTPLRSGSAESATCSNPKFTPDAVSPHEALTLLERVTNLPEHKFWPADLALSDAISKLEPSGPLRKPRKLP